MIDWAKSAELNNKTIIELKLYLERFPRSNKKICRICDICGRIKWLSYSDYVDVCRLCSLHERKIEEPVCNVCGNILIIDDNWSKHSMEKSDHRCKDCINTYSREQYIKNRKINGLPLKRDHKSKIKTISHYISYDNTVKKEVVWRQKINEDGDLQGIGYFSIRKPGRMILEKRRASNRKWRPIMEAKRRGFGFIKLDIGHPDCDWHHVTKDLVVSVPRIIHKKIKHKLGDGNMIEGLIG
jgi:hypothetical protein